MAKTNKTEAAADTKAKASPKKATDVPTADLRASDVLLGRGNKVLNFPGNTTFRRIVDSHRSAYVNADGNASKNQAARDVLHTVKTGEGVPSASGDASDTAAAPGRFMKKKSVDSDLWDEVTDDVALEKCKMSLRQIDRREQKKEARLAARKASGGGGAAAAEKGGKKGKKNVSSSAVSSSGSGKRKSREGNLPPKRRLLKRSDESADAEGDDAGCGGLCRHASPTSTSNDEPGPNERHDGTDGPGGAGWRVRITPSPRWCPWCCCSRPPDGSCHQRGHVHRLHAASAAVPAGSCRRRSRRQGWRGRRCR
mmetsp:Transcript_18047/g.40029  ORF Transcript_18047/g.40029 Transcript_18047/m.40029 type:complete len:310 (+) Transcript_18047:353-1282(+)